MGTRWHRLVTAVIHPNSAASRAKYWYRYGPNLFTCDEAKFRKLLFPSTCPPAAAIPDWNDFANYIWENLEIVASVCGYDLSDRVEMLLAQVAKYGNRKDAFRLYVLHKALIVRAKNDGNGTMVYKHAKVDQHIDELLTSAHDVLSPDGLIYLDCAAAFRCLNAAFEYNSDIWMDREKATHFHNRHIVRGLRIMHESSLDEIQRAVDAAFEHRTLKCFPAELRELIYETLLTAEGVPIKLDILEDINRETRLYRSLRMLGGQ